jgi:hypothetical protein
MLKPDIYFTILVTFQNKKWVSKISTSANVYVLKNHLQNLTNIKIEDQYLQLDGRNLNQLNRYLIFYDIKDNSTINISTIPLFSI